MRAVLTYAIDLTRAPAMVEEQHVRAMREAGLGDDQALGVNLIISYFNFVNRVAEGLEVDVTLEEVSRLPLLRVRRRGSGPIVPREQLVKNVQCTGKTFVPGAAAGDHRTSGGATSVILPASP